MIKMTIKFMDDEHEANYYKVLDKMTCSDAYHRAVAYLLTLDKVCRQHLKEIFDFEEYCIKPESLDAGWQTSSSLRTTCLAFNLWNGYAFDSSDCISLLFTVDSIFSGSNSYTPYYFTAIKLRYYPVD